MGGIGCVYMGGISCVCMTHVGHSMGVCDGGHWMGVHWWHWMSVHGGHWMSVHIEHWMGHGCTCGQLHGPWFQ